MTAIAVIDLETTGLHPSTDRIIEIAVVQLHPPHYHLGGAHWNTLINPQRHPGPTHAHGITAQHLEEAPRFADIADELSELLSGRTLAAHNINFDNAFLRHEHQRLRRPWPGHQHLDTGRLAHQLRHIPRGGNRSLTALCARAGIPYNGEHSALGDALATARLLRAYLAQIGAPIAAEGPGEVFRAGPGTRALPRSGAHAKGK